MGMLTRLNALFKQFNETYRAYVGAFDTPIARRKHDDEYAQDARRRMQDFAEVFRGFMDEAEQELSSIKQTERTPWAPYLIDRADGVKGHFAIGRWNPAGYQEVWNLRGRGWASASDDVLSEVQAVNLLRTLYLGNVGWKLAMRVFQSGLYQELEDDERVECDLLVRRNPYMSPNWRAAERAVQHLDQDGKRQAQEKGNG